MINKVLEIFVPSTINRFVGEDKIVQHIDGTEFHAKFVNAVCAVIAQKFGGFTSLPGKGGWFDVDTNELVTENVTIVQTFVSDITDHDIEFLRYIACLVGRALRQDAVTIRVNGETEFYPTN